MMTTKPLKAVFGLLILGACASSETPLGDPPPATEIERVARQAHELVYGSAPIRMQIGQLQQVPMFFDSNEWLVCVSSEQKTLGPTFDNAGNLIAAEGTPFRQSHGLHLKQYSFGWGSGIYRRVEEGKIGRVNIGDYCPDSETSW